MIRLLLCCEEGVDAVDALCGVRGWGCGSDATLSACLVCSPE